MLERLNHTRSTKAGARVRSMAMAHSAMPEKTASDSQNVPFAMSDAERHVETAAASSTITAKPRP
jgi:hypothetical protein